MINFKGISFILFCTLSFFVVKGQVQIGEWRAHLHYKRAFKTVEAGDFIYCATENGLFHIHKDDNTMTLLSKVDGLSGVEVVNIGYDVKTENVFVAYNNGMVDMLGINYIVPIPYIANASSIIGNKTVNNFYFDNGLAYMATNFGVVVYDINNREVRESYLNLDEKGNQLAINDVAVYNNRVYVSTNNGLRSGSLSDNLLDFSFWQTDITMGCDAMQVFENKLIIHLTDNRVVEWNGADVKDYEPMAWAVVRHLELQNEKLVVTKSKNILIFNPNGKVDSVESGAPAHGLLD
ncbi:MAG: hypothetical protein ACPGLV_18775, partial [Bacteroidia bacterium]